MNATPMVRDIPITRYGAAGTLNVRERADEAVLADDEIAIDVRYSGINFADIQMRLGFYPAAPKKPFVPGYEVSGTVASVGRDVTSVRPGDPVVAGTFFGGYTSRAVVKDYQAFPLPGGTTLEQGAALPVNFFTAWIALMEMARIREGDKLLVECATGGVGTLAIQMANHLGAEVVGLTTSPHKLDYIEALGARAMTRETFYADRSVGGFDVIVNASGGAEVKRQLPRLGMTGRMVCMGVNSGVKDGRRNIPRMLKAVIQMPRLSILKMFDPNIGVFALNALTILEDERWVRKLTGALDQIDTMGLRPHVDKVFEAESVSDAHQYLETKQARGKVLLSW